MSHRTERMAEAIREVVSKMVLFEVADPRVRAVTVLRVEVSGDHRNATVYVSVMGTPAEQKTAMQGLKSAKGFLQSRVAHRLQTRFTPILAFKLDDSVRKSVEMSRLIDETIAADRRNHPQTAAPTETTDEHDEPTSEDKEES
jgi:ribosome-binding factor A